MGARYSCIRLEYSNLGKILRKSDTFFSTPNGMFSSNKEFGIKFNFTEFSEIKLIARKFHVLPEKQKLPYDVSIGRYLMKELHMDVLYSEDVVVWDGVRPTIQKIQNGKWKDLNLMDQEDLDIIKEQFIRLGRILDDNYKKVDLKQEVNKSIYLTKFQQVILLSCLKLYKYFFNGILGDWTRPPIENPLKDKYKPYHARYIPIRFIHLKA